MMRASVFIPLGIVSLYPPLAHLFMFFSPLSTHTWHPSSPWPVTLAGLMTLIAR